MSTRSSHRVLPLALVVVLAACGSGDHPPPLTQLPDGTPAFSHAGLVTDSLTGHLIVATSVIGEPRYMAVSGSELWIADRSGDPYLHVVDLIRDSLVLSRGQDGEGPGDFAEVPQLSVRPGRPRGHLGLRRQPATDHPGDE